MIYSIGLEQDILGAIMFLKGSGDSVETALDKLTVKDFYARDNKQIFLAMKEIQASGRYPDLALVNEHRFCEEIFLYVMEMVRNTASGLNLIKNVDRLRDFTQLRMVQDRVNTINEIIASNESMESKLNDIDQVLSLDSGLVAGEVGAKHITECMPKYIDKLELRWTNPDEVIFATGIPDLDEIFDGGLEVGLHAIAARPKMGKTELMVKMINHVTVDRKLPAYVASMEMSDDQVIERSVSAIGHVDKSLIKSNFDPAKSGGEDPEVLRGSFMEACKYLHGTDLYIDDRHDMKVSMIKRECRKILKKHGKIGGVYIDYLTLMQADGAHDRNDLAVASMTRALKGLSKELGCPVVLLLQLNRGCEDRPDKRPIPRDSRDSGAIEQDVDSWIGLYRDSVYNEDSEWGSITEIIVRLNRHGGTGTAYQMLTGHGFLNVAHETIGKLEQRASSKAEEKTNKFKKDTGYF